MKNWIKNTFLVTIFLTAIILNGCSTKNDNKAQSVKTPSYSTVTVVEKDQGADKIFNVNNKELLEGGTINNVMDMVYNIKNSIYVYLVNSDTEENFNNKIVIIDKDKKSEVKNFFTALDIKLNSSGDKLAFRIFKNNSIDSAEGMKVYDIKNKKYIELKSKVMVSGNLYEWLDKDRIIYYGSIQGEKNSSKIYLYDFNTNKESIYLDNTEGYCVYFAPINNNVLFLSRQEDNLILHYYNSEENKTAVLSRDIIDIYQTVINKQDGDIYFLGSEGEKDAALYRLNGTSLSLERITYDFPKMPGVTSGIASDEEGNIYFTGLQNVEEQNKMDVYMYNKLNKATKIISVHEGVYRVYSNYGG